MRHERRAVFRAGVSGRRPRPNPTNGVPARALTPLSSRSVTRSIVEYAAIARRQGREAFLENHRHPVLLADLDSLGEEVEFFTASVASPRPSSKMGDVPRWVIDVKKRAGGLFPDRVGIGRARNTDVMLRDNRVSKYHAYFTTAGGVWLLTDAKSKNGTFVGERRLKEGAPEPVSDGQTLSFGGVDVRFTLPPSLWSLLATL